MSVWHLITSEYPPQLGGVADYTQVVAAGLAEAGDEVHVWCPAENEQPEESTSTCGVAIHRQLGCFSPSDLRRAGKLLDRFPAPRRMLVQWVPHGYGYHAMNLHLCLWLWRRATFNGDHVEVMVHEAYLRFRAGAARQAVVAVVQRLMTLILLNSTQRVWMSIPAWAPMLKRYALGRSLSFRWLPIPSVLPTVEQFATNQVRVRCGIACGEIIGHFGTYNPAIAEPLTRMLPPLLEGRSELAVLLIGAGSEQFRQCICERNPHLTSRIHATGVLSPQEVTNHLTACDLVIQPYPDGVSSRRTTVMTALALGVPVVTTKGHLTEWLWDDAKAVSLTRVADCGAMVRHAERLLSDSRERKRLGDAGHDLYLRRFDLRHTIAALRGLAVPEPAAGLSDVSLLSRTTSDGN